MHVHEVFMFWFPDMLCIAAVLILTAAAGGSVSADELPWMNASRATMEAELVRAHGPAEAERIRRGVGQVASFWRAEDGDAAVFEEFVRTNFAGTQESRDTMFQRFETLLEQLDGHLAEIGRVFRTQTDLDLGPIMPYDAVFAGYDPGAHLLDDFFANKLAFTVLLNFPLTTLGQRVAEGAHWSRREWAEARLAQRFSKRIPAEVNLQLARAGAEADRYIADYNIFMHHVLNEKGERLFPAGMRLLSHWNLRDQIKADYADARRGLEKQRIMQKVMERIVTQTIPAVVVNNPHVDWNPFSNEVRPAAVNDAEGVPPADLPVSSAPEPDTRYAVLLKTFHAAKGVDPYSPSAPTLIARRFDENREIPEERFEKMLKQVLSSPLVGRVAAIIERRLGRPLEPFDIWYNGFRSGSNVNPAELDALVAKKYPTAEAYVRDMPRMLTRLGFSPDRAAMLAGNIVVDPARGSGHAQGAAMRSAKTHLRTRIEKTGMNYKGFNIAVHEMGHNVEQTISLNMVDHWLLQGVPNTAFTEAVAFVFQKRDLDLLGAAAPDGKNEALSVLNDFWGTYEIAGVALVDMAIWHWMYDHPAATPAQLKEATLNIARGIWNRYYAPVFKKKDIVLLGIYSHIIHSNLYLPDYPLGHMIAHQIEEQVTKAGNIGTEVERMTKMGSVAPDLWMQNATGAPVGPEALLAAAERALAEVVRQD